MLGPHSSDGTVWTEQSLTDTYYSALSKAGAPNFSRFVFSM
jgi:hypothetical protein